MNQNNQIKQYNFTQEQISKLFQMQDQLNTYVHPQWRDQDFDWYEAIVDECCELKGHLGWKWWKQNYKCGLTEANKKQVQLEVIDLLHFLISGLLDGKLETAGSVTGIFNGSQLPSGITLENAVDKMRFYACDGYYGAVQWTWIALLTGLTEQEILETYTQKYVLNKFRQDHGYKDGSYCKEWELNVSPGEFLEDNEVLSFVVFKLKNTGQDTTDETELYNRLEAMYTSRLNQ